MQLIEFPSFSGVRCLMMPYIQGDTSSVPSAYSSYYDIIENVYLRKGDIGFLTIDESHVTTGNPHRGQRAKFGRALHTEAGFVRNGYVWGPPSWGGKTNVQLDRDVRVLLANNLDNSCAIWNEDRTDTTDDGDIGHLADLYPYSNATMLAAGEVHEIGILTPHESLPVPYDFDRQFLRIVSSGVHGREDYFTANPRMDARS